MSKQKTHITARTIGTALVGTLSVITAFAIGLRTAGEVETIAPIEANELLIMSGDLNGDNMVNEEDVSLAIEFSEGYDTPTVQQLKADPNRDGVITAADALTILKLIDSAR